MLQKHGDLPPPFPNVLKKVGALRRFALLLWRKLGLPWQSLWVLHFLPVYCWNKIKNLVISLCHVLKKYISGTAKNSKVKVVSFEG